MVEEWRDVVGYHGYEVSDQGRVRSYRDRYGFNVSKRLVKPYYMTLQINENGYRFVRLIRDGRQHKCYVNNLVATAFIPNPENKPEANHINGDKSNNCVWNLEWATHAENMAHAYRTGLCSFEKNIGKAIEACKRSVYCYETDEIFDSVDEAANYFGVTKGCITLCCQGKSHHVKGYHLSYADDADYLRRNIESIKAIQGQRRRVKAININTGEELVYPSRQAASADLGISDSYISNIIAGRSYQTRGWTFEDLPVFLEER